MDNYFSNTLDTSKRQLRDEENIFTRAFNAATNVVTDEVQKATGGIIKMPSTDPPMEYGPAPQNPSTPATSEKSDLTKTVSDYVKAIPSAGYIGGAASGAATYFATKHLGISFAATVLGTAISGVVANKIKQHKEAR